MKNYLPLFFFITMMNFVTNSTAQNLVPNPSFEIYSSCPNDIGQIDSATGWTIFGNGQSWGFSTPDYYNECAIANQWPDSFASIPYNWCGYQEPDTGKAYAGIVCYAITVANLHEIIGCNLITPLEIGQTYQISFKANCSYGGYEANEVACNGIGVKFTTIPYTNDHPIPIDNNPVLYSDAVITDTLNWITVEGLTLPIQLTTI